MNTPTLSDYSTQAARADERRRRKLYKQLMAQWQRQRTTLSDESVAGVLAITDAEWQAAQSADEEDADAA